MIALAEVVLLFVVFWTTRAVPSSGRKWGLRLVAVVVITILAGVVAKDARASAVVGEYSVYFGIPAILIYYFAKNRVGAAAPVSRRPQPRRPVRRG